MPSFKLIRERLLELVLRPVHMALEKMTIQSIMDISSTQSRISILLSVTMLLDTCRNAINTVESALKAFLGDQISTLEFASNAIQEDKRTTVEPF